VNQKNVDALEALLAERLPDDPVSCKTLAVWLAAKGCLVSETLTDEECKDVWDAGGEALYGDPFPTFTQPGLLRAELERIAKGEPG
jgi:hypothetical protein